MYDVVGKIAAFLLASIIFFFGTTTLYAQKQDTIVQNYVEAAVEEFVDTARTSGYISQSAYNNLVARLDATKNVYEVSIIHSEAKTNFVNSGETTFEDNFEAHTKQEILSRLDEQSGLSGASPKYVMKNGDFIRVEVVNNSPTLARKMFGMFIGATRNGGQIRCSYGGYIGYTN